MSSTFLTLIAAPVGDMAPGSPADWDRLPADARAWADNQAGQGNEMLTVQDGDQSAALQNNYEVYLVRL
jgi:N-acetyl-anhydromuramyl-L-alanine amidase AmpD